MRIEWVHPTWRDLVIGMLIADHDARLRFLRRCGVHGVELALSTAGGSAGERRLPLVRSDKDWDALGDRLYELAAELDAHDLIAALAALTVALDDLAGTPAIRREGTALSEALLARLAGLWSMSATPIAVDLLDAWLNLGRRLQPHPAPPELTVTWAALLPIRTPSCDDRAALERFADWLVLCELLRGYDDAVLERLGFGPDQLALALAFALEVERHPDRVTPATEDPTLRAVECIGRLAPEYSALPETVIRQLRRSAIERAGPQQLTHSELALEFANLGPLDVGRVLADL